MMANLNQNIQGNLFITDRQGVCVTEQINDFVHKYTGYNIIRPSQSVEVYSAP